LSADVTKATMRPTDAAIERFIHVKNLILLRKRIAKAITPAQRLQALKLLLGFLLSEWSPPPSRSPALRHRPRRVGSAWLAQEAESQSRL